MIIPRFSLKALIGLVTVASLASLVVAAAFRGESWAMGVVFGALFIPLFFIVNIVIFALAWSLAQFRRSKVPEALPPQPASDPTPSSPQG